MFIKVYTFRPIECIAKDVSKVVVSQDAQTAIYGNKIKNKKSRNAGFGSLDLAMLNVFSSYVQQVGCQLEKKEESWMKWWRVVTEAAFNGYVG